MTALWTSEEAISATGGTCKTIWEATGVSIDTRTLNAGDLFVALKDVRDGHEFVASALEKGAAAALVSHRPIGLADDAPLLVVPDVLQALEALGQAARARTGAQVLAITGSVGKTSTKEMIRAALAGQGRIHAAEASYNNHWGVPLTLARMPQDADFAIIEIGMSHPGEIAPLARMAAPHVAIVTTVAPAHLEAFDGLDAIAREKGAIFDGLVPGGTAILNGDLETTPILRSLAEASAETVLTFGVSEACDYRQTDVHLSKDATVVCATRRETPVLFKVGVAGRHFALNALAGIAASEALGANPDLAAIGLGAWTPPKGRGTRETISLDIVDDTMVIDLIDDAFNANPASLSAALEVLEAATPVDDVGRIARGRRIAILGDMLELGPDELAFHAKVADHPAVAMLEVVHCVGPRMTALWDALPQPKRGRKVDTAEELAANVHQILDAGDVVLVKGSKGSRVSLVVDAIRKLGQPSPEGAR